VTSTPTTFASTKQFLMCGTETVQGQVAAPTFTQLIDTFKPKDVPVWIDDKAWRGSMGTDSFAVIQGVKKSTASVGGPVYGDGLPYWLRNLLGDLAVTGTPTGSGATTLSAQATAGATSLTTAASIPASTIIQIGSGATAEACTTGTPTGAGPYTIPLANGYTLAYTHASAQAVTPIQGPYTYVWSLLNSGSGQPLSHTLTHFLGPTATSGARQYPGACMSDMSFAIKPATALFTWSGNLTAYPSAAAGSQPTANGTGILPIAAWQTKVGIGGPASGGTLLTTPGDITIDLKRELEAYYTSQGSQSPYIIQRGGLSCTGKIMFPAVPDESSLLYMLNNTQPQLQVVVSNGLSGTALITIQFDIQVAAFTTSEDDTSKPAVAYQDGFKAVFNTTNAGGSGGLSPLKISVTNNVAPGTY
jgi:hypothetical protein